MILENIGIHGWSRAKEVQLISHLVTGAPCLIIGEKGSAKSLLVNQLAKAMSKSFVHYDASKASFDDVLGIFDPSKLMNEGGGVVEFIRTPITVWDKDFVFVDEINRASPDMQSKWLEILRERKIMGYPTGVKWAFAAMNPSTYVGTKDLDEALIGRFASFIEAPIFLSMSSTDREAVISTVSRADSPALDYWGIGGKFVSVVDGFDLEKFVHKAAVIYNQLDEHIGTVLNHFVEKYLALVNSEIRSRGSKFKFEMDGRRAGMVKRNIMAVRSVDLAIIEAGGDYIPFSVSAMNAITMSFPIGVGGKANQTITIDHIAVLESVFGMVKDILDNNEELETLNTLYALISSPNSVERVRAAFSDNFGKIERIYGWKTIATEVEEAIGKNGEGFTPLPFIILARERVYPNSIDAGLIAKMAGYFRDVHTNIQKFASSALANRKFQGIDITDEEFEAIKKVIQDAGNDNIKIALAVSDFTVYLKNKKANGGTSYPMAFLNTYYINCAIAESIIQKAADNAAAAPPQAKTTKATSKSASTAASKKEPNNAV